MPALEAIAVATEKAAEIAAEVAVEVGKKIAEITAEEAKEIATKSIEAAEKTKEVVVEKLNDIKAMSPEQLREQMEKNLSEKNSDSSTETDEGTKTKEGLTDEQKQRIKEETGWSDEIIDAIGSWEEYEIYKKAGLVESEINGRKCLIRSDMDWNQKDKMGRTNRERVEQGLAPINKDNKIIEVHHMGQRANGPFAELTQEEHHSGGNDTILHDKKKVTEVHGDRNKWTTERINYWKERINSCTEGG